MLFDLLTGSRVEKAEDIPLHRQFRHRGNSYCLRAVTQAAGSACSGLRIIASVARGSTSPWNPCCRHHGEVTYHNFRLA